MAKRNIDKMICFPGEEGWELWKLKEDRFGQTDYELLDTRDLDESGSCEPFKDATHYAFPINSVYAVPIWVGTDDPDAIKSLVEMQLEKTGLKPTTGAGQLLDFQTVCVVEGQQTANSPDDLSVPMPTRSLILATVLNPEYRHPLPKTGSKEFDVSARFLSLPGNHIVIWKELGRLVMAITRGGKLEYFEGLTSLELDLGAIHEINCIMLGLDGAGPVSEDSQHGIAAELSGIHIWLDEFDDSVGAELQHELGLDSTVGSRPDPILPDDTSNLVPEQVAVQREDQKKSKIIRLVILACAAIYIVFLGIMAWGYFGLKMEANKLADQVSNIEPGVVWIPEFRQKWDALSPTLNSSEYPSELLHRATGAVPPQNVRFTSFKFQDGTITIEGQSKDAKAGRDFGALLFKRKDLSDYKWAWLKQPQVDPRKKDRTAAFQIQGSR